MMKRGHRSITTDIARETTTMATTTMATDIAVAQGDAIIRAAETIVVATSVLTPQRPDVGKGFHGSKR